MAKKQRVIAVTPAPKPHRSPFNSRLIASGFLGASLVYLSYHPSDAAAVEMGDALWFGMLSLATCLFTFAATPSGTYSTRWRSSLWSSRALDITVGSLAAWMMFAAFANASVGDLRQATNEAWLWVSGAAWFLSARRLTIDEDVRRSIAVLIVVCASGLAVHALHQTFVTLPMNRIAFEQDPETVLAMAGYDAPEGSSERAIFAGRLMDGGPTGTFALANSLAAMLIAGILLSSGVVCFAWRVITHAQRAAWSATGSLCVAALLTTRSRTAVIATLLGLFLIFMGRTSWSRANKKLLSVVALISIVCGGVGYYLLTQFGSTASTSLAFRFQYWWATLRMVTDRPLFGAGPGNFQAVYERYRDATTSEQIADPHNLFFETLGSGGFIALALLIASFIFAIHFVWKSTRDETAVDSTAESDHGRSVWLGAAIALLLVWLFGLATRALPDVDASLYVLPIAAVLAFVLAPSISKLNGHRLDFLLGVVLLMVLLHLMVSGGWTVPGVAIIVWFCAAVVTRVPYRSTEATPEKISFVAIGLCLVMMGVMYFMSVRPVTIANHQLAIAAGSIGTGRSGQVERALEIAADADPWSPVPAVELASQHRWRLVQVESPRMRQSWEAELERAKHLGGQDPALLREIGLQQLHLFQRYGRPEDLAAAEKTFQRAVDWSPVNQWMLAQLATIAQAAGDPERARQLAAEARKLSELGVNAERGFHFQQIYPAMHFGEFVKQGPIRRSAVEVLSEL